MHCDKNVRTLRKGISLVIIGYVFVKTLFLILRSCLNFVANISRPKECTRYLQRVRKLGVFYFENF